MPCPATEHKAAVFIPVFELTHQMEVFESLTSDHDGLLVDVVNTSAIWKVDPAEIVIPFKVHQIFFQISEFNVRLLCLKQLLEGINR